MYVYVILANPMAQGYYSELLGHIEYLDGKYPYTIQ